MQANSTDDSNCELPGEIHTRLQLDLSTADRDLRRALNDFWSSAAANPPFSILNHQHTELIPIFEIYGTHILHARADNLVRQGLAIPEVKALLKQELTPQTIGLIVPSGIIPGSFLEPTDLSLMKIDYGADGCWEYWLRLTWEDFAARQASPLDLDTWWRHQFQIVLRFADHRQPFISGLRQRLTRSIVDWEPDAWRLKLESSTTPLTLDAGRDGIRSVKESAEGVPGGAAGSGSASGDAAALDTTAGLLEKNSQPRRPVRHHPSTKAIDDLLKKFSQARPKDHRQVFELLDGRVEAPHAQPFKSAGGWIAGFKKKPDQAHAWLSKAWTRLGLPQFRRGPK